VVEDSLVRGELGRELDSVHPDLASRREIQDRLLKTPQGIPQDGPQGHMGINGQFRGYRLHRGRASELGGLHGNSSLELVRHLLHELPGRLLFLKEDLKIREPGRYPPNNPEGKRLQL